MKKITLLLFALLAFASIVMSTNKKDDMTTAIKIDTSRPLPDQIPCNDIDSIAYSAILDSTGRTVGYNQNVFTPDTILAYPVDSIRQTEFMDITDDEVVRKNFSNLSDYMESQGFTGKDASTVRDNIKSWLTSQPEVEGVTLINDDTDIKITYRNGKEAYVSFISLDEYDTPENEPQATTSAPKSADSDKIYVNIEAQPDEEILPNANILYSKVMKSPFFWLLCESESDIQEVIDESPVNATLRSNKNPGDLNFLIENLANAGIAIVSHTHGTYIDGGFQVDNNYSQVGGVRVFIIYRKNKIYEFWKKTKIYAIRTDNIIKLIDAGKGVALMNYCGSSGFGEFVKKYYPEKAKRDFVGYIDTANAIMNTSRVLNYLRLMLNGYVHSKALEKVNSQYYTDGQTFVSHNCGNDYRLFSIESRPPKAHTDKGVAEVEFMVKGWNNLKKDINSVKIWYSPEPFANPDKECGVITVDLNNNSLQKDNNGLNIKESITLNGVDSTYYCLGFEYKGKTYHGKTQSVAFEPSDGWSDSGTEFYSNGYRYVINDDCRSVSLIYKSKESHYWGLELVVPNSVKYEGRNYKVTRVWYNYNYQYDNSINKDLRKVKLGNNVTELLLNCFHHAEYLGNIDLNNVETIYGSAFTSCYRLKSISSSKVKVLGYSHDKNYFPLWGTFQGCRELTSVDFPNLEIINISNVFTSINGKLERIDFPKLRQIAASAFALIPNLKEVRLPILENIPLSTFADCPNLKTVFIPEALSLGKRAFENCTSLEHISLPKVIEIGDNPFAGCSSLKSADFPNAIHSGDRAFSDLSSLTSVNIPKAETIGYQCFKNCSSLTSIAFNNVDSIAREGFAECASLTDVSLPNVRVLEYQAFYNCPLTGKVSMPNLQIMSDRVFGSCDFDSMELPQLKQTGAMAFGYCKSLTEVNFPHLDRLGRETFKGCENLRAVNLGSVTWIEPDAFSGCSNLELITITNPTPPVIYSSSTTFPNYNATLKVPAGSEEAYKAHEVWGKFNIVTE